LSTQGKPGTKPRPKGVGDVELVHIPVPLVNRLSEVVTHRGKPSHCWTCAFKPVGFSGRQIRQELTREVKRSPVRDGTGVSHSAKKSL